MEFALSGDQAMMRDTARRIAEEKLKPHARDIDEREAVHYDTIRELGEMGFMAMMVPEAYGGAGLDTLSYVLAVEEFSRVCASTGVCVSVNNSLFADGVFAFGTEDQKKAYLPPLGRGEAQACLALTEPGAGTDVGSTVTSALKDGTEYVINGKKHFVTNGGF
ncbi:MAG: acyl-CoA dehydrogenase, partial [Gemmatimonadetes bacterium]|nr:acyl-CoA dehydrogenase [Gemmatimonadota bacterium]